MFGLVGGWGLGGEGVGWGGGVCSGDRIWLDASRLIYMFRVKSLTVVDRGLGMGMGLDVFPYLKRL